MLLKRISPGYFDTCLVILLLSIVWTSAEAKREWYKYENDHFVAYSDAKEKKVRNLLDSLERFRGAVLQVSNIAVPDSAPKTLVLIPRKKADFRKLITSNNTGGFAAEIGGRTVIVIPASGFSSHSKVIIRHEYGHALLNYSSFTYPSWYNEGFAEMVSATRFLDDGQSFTIGEVTDRAVYNGPPVFEWQKLISDGFSPHNVVGLRKASSAYFQAWLLVHYTTLGNNFENAIKLQAYFDRLKNGEPSIDAFEQVFGIAAASIWEQELKSYTKRIPYYTISFKPKALDMTFNKEPADEGDYLPIVNYFQKVSTVYNNPKPLKKPLAKLPGRWTSIEFNRQCNDPDEIRVDSGNQTIEVIPIGHEHSDGQLTGMFHYTRPEKTTLRIEPAMAGIDSNKFVWEMDMRSDDLVCLRRPNWPESRCQILERCP